MVNGSDSQPSQTKTQNGDELTWKEIGQTLINNSGSGISVINSKGVIALSNLRVQKTMNLYPGLNIGDQLPKLWPVVAKTLNDRQVRSDEMLKQNGIEYMVQICPIHLKNRMIGAFCLFEEQTSQSSMESQPQSSNNMNFELEGVIDSVSDGVWISDCFGKVLRVNRVAEKNNQIRASDVVGRYMHELLAQGIFDFSTTLEVIRTGAPINMVRKNRFGRKIMLTGTPIFNTAGKLIRVIVTDRDVTELSTLRQELEEQEAIKNRMRHQLVQLQLHELESNHVIARSSLMLKLLQHAKKISQFNSTVLILGESGSGKGLIADLIHKYSRRAEQPIIKINCGAIPETLIEMELFGYEKGAFTGARKEGKPGLFELADKGTIFLDEIGELPIMSQTKLLRFLEDGRVTRIGGTVDRKLDVRVLCATHRDLETMVKEKKFRFDLFYRLNVIPVKVPPLRERRECIPALIRHQFQSFCKKLEIKKPPQLTRKAMDALIAFDYPGNVRELMNMCERLLVMAEGQWIDVDDLPSKVIDCVSSDRPQNVFRKGLSLARMLENVEKEILVNAQETYTTQTKIAEALCVNQSTVARKIKKYGLQ